MDSLKMISNVKKMVKKIDDRTLHLMKRVYMVADMNKQMPNSSIMSASKKKIKQYEQQYKELQRKFSAVHVYRFYFGAIGETIPCLFTCVLEKKGGDRSLVLGIPVLKGHGRDTICNSRIMDIFGDEITFLNNENADFWKYVFSRHNRWIDYTKYFEYYTRNRQQFLVDYKKPIIQFCSGIRTEAKKNLNNMGINKPFICIHARSIFIKGVDTGLSSTSINVALSTYTKTCNYFLEKGYQVIRMGKYEREECTIDGVIDYANHYHNDLMDFYLIANCEMMIGSMSGLSYLPPYWGTPVLRTNCLLFGSLPSMPRTQYDSFIPKKMYRNGRQLSLKEMLDILDKCSYYDENLRALNVTWRDNSEDEIFRSSIEIFMKIKGEWRVTEEQQKLITRYYAIINRWISNNKKNDDYLIKIPISISYLETNEYLLCNDI